MFPCSQYQVFVRNLVLLTTLYILGSLFFSLHFHRNTHYYPTSYTPLGVWTTSPKTFRFINELNSACIVSFHFCQSFQCQHFSTFYGLGSSSFLMMSKATWKAKILLITYNFDPIYILCAHNSFRSHNFKLPMPL